MKKKITLISIVLFNLFSLNAQDFEVAPVKLNFSAEPGETQSKTITIRNHANRKTAFVVTLGDFQPDSKGNKKKMKANTTKHSCANWISISPAFFELNPNDEKTITVNMQVPVDDYSTRWAMIYIKTTQEQTAFTADKELRAGVTVSGRIAVLVFQSPKSNTNYSATINNLIEVTEAKDTIRKFTANIDNVGDKIMQCKVYLIASDLLTAEETNFDPITIESYPKSSQTVELKMPKNLLPSGKYALAAVLDFGSKTNLEGTQLLITVP
ncbi:MAG: hypothetical protein KAG95_05070 [Bacteroidales bacterium]|nr:hypothetical protein [Bacteroidales bacterium]